MRRINKIADRLIKLSKTSLQQFEKSLIGYYNKAGYKVVYALLRKKLNDNVYKSILDLTLTQRPINRSLLKTLMGYKKMMCKYINLVNVVKNFGMYWYYRPINKEYVLRTIAKVVNEYTLPLLSSKEIRTFIIRGMNPHIVISKPTKVCCIRDVRARKVDKGMTLLQMVTVMDDKYSNRLSLANMLISRGANPFVIDKEGNTPLKQFLLERPSIVPLLKQLGSTWYYNPLMNKKDTVIDDKNFFLLYRKNLQSVQRELFEILKKARGSKDSPFYMDVFPRDLFKEILSYLKIVF